MLLVWCTPYAARSRSQPTEQPASPPATASQTRIGNFTITFYSLKGNFKTGDFIIPSEITGHSADGDLRADRGLINKQNEATLIGHVVVHQRIKPVKPGQPAELLTLTCDQLQINNKAKISTATGNARATQGDRTLTAATMRLDEIAHVLNLQGAAHAQEGLSSVDSEQMQYNTASGDFVVPTPVRGRASDGDFQADRASGNQKNGTTTLVGNVVVHKLGGVGKNPKNKDPITMNCDVLEVDNIAKQYAAKGHVKLVQGGRTLQAPEMTLDDIEHIAHLFGGVHAEEAPDRSFDAAEVLYNTQTQDFRAFGGVHVSFPLPSPTPSRSPPPKKRLL